MISVGKEEEKTAFEHTAGYAEYVKLCRGRGQSHANNTSITYASITYRM